MGVRVELQTETEEELRMRMLLEHTPGKFNKIPDYLSRGMIKEIIALMKARRGIDPMRIDLGAWWNEWPERIGRRIYSMRHPEGNWDDYTLKELMQLDGQIEEIARYASSGRNGQ